MSNFRLPMITATTPEGKIDQMNTFLFQLVEQLNYATREMETDSEDRTLSVVTGGGSSIEEANKEAKETFDAVKSLIIKSADIVNAYYDEINRKLISQYEALSDYGYFKEDTQRSITETAKNTTDTIRRVETIEGELNLVNEYKGWIKTGIIDTKDGKDVYGIEVGKTDTKEGQDVFTRFARFTAEGLYFYLPSSNPDQPVAQMTSNQLIITNAVVTGTLQIGQYIINTNSGIAFKWVGG